MTYPLLGLIGLALLAGLLWLGQQAREVRGELERLPSSEAEPQPCPEAPCGYMSYRWDVPHSATRVVVIDREWRERQRYLVHWN